jgi:hypothetical protein
MPLEPPTLPFDLPISHAGGATGDTLYARQGALLVSCPRPFQRHEGAFACPEPYRRIGGAECIPHSRESMRHGVAPPDDRFATIPIAPARRTCFDVRTCLWTHVPAYPLRAEGESADEPRDRRTRSSKLQPPPPPQALGCFRRFRLSGRHRPQRKGRTDCARGASHGRHQAID